MLKKTLSLTLIFVLFFSGAGSVFAKTTTKIYYFLPDHLGGVDKVLDENGNIVQNKDYGAFGDDRVPPPSNPVTDYGFTGKEKDTETGLYNYGARQLDPVTGRFTTMDPVVLGEGGKPLESILENPQALNPYGYALNNPLRYTDPTGMIPREASFSSKLNSVLTLDHFGKESGWLASSIKRYLENPNPETASELKSRQSLAIDRLTKDPSGFTDETWDPITTKRIQQLDPQLHVPATDFINRAESEANTQLRVTDGYRDAKKQDLLYAQGRTAPGKIVTYSRGKTSYHNYGLALDVVKMKEGKPVWEAIGENIATIATSLGFEWGGYWKQPKTDFPHFQMPLGQSIETLQAKDKKN